MDVQTHALLGATIIGIVNMVRLQFPQVKGLLSLLLAIALGVGASFLNIFPGLTWQLGLITAFASAGVYKVAVKAGGN